MTSPAGWTVNHLPLWCFGSRGSFDEMQVKEIAYALEKSSRHFVWSLRRPPSDQILNAPGDYEDPRVILSEGFFERTAGGFISHCGWNSLLESLWFGVPLATWLIYAEQKLNAFEMVVELGLAVEIKLDFEKDLFYPKADTVIIFSDEIENRIRRLIDDDNLRAKVKEMSRTTLKEGGSSYASVDSLIYDIINDS